MQLNQGVRKNFGKMSPEPGNKWPYTPDRRVLIFFFSLDREPLTDFRLSEYD